MADLGGLSGLGMYGGYLQAEELGADVNKRKYENQIQQAGDAAFGRTLMALNQQQPQGPPPPQMQGPMGGGMGGGAPPGPPPGPPPVHPTMQMAPGMPLGGPPLPQPRPPQAPPAAPMPPQQPMGGQPQSPMGGPPMAPQGGGMPMQPQGGPPQQAGMGGQPPPTLNWQVVLQKVQQANPGAPPQVLAAAVDRFMPLMNQQSAMQWKEMSIALREQGLQIQQQRADTTMNLANVRAAQAGQKQDQQATRVSEIVDGLESGKIPPTLTGMYRDKSAIEAEASKRGLNLSQMQQEWARANKTIMSLNGPQMVRFYGLAGSVQNTIGEVKDLAEQMKLSGITPLNHAELSSLMTLRGNTPEGQLATRYVTAINTLKEEFANLAQGGYAPTESVWALANKQINENYGVEQLTSSLDEINRLIGYRVQGLQSIGGGNLGPNAPNRYTGGGQQQPLGAAGGAAGEANTVVKPPETGSQPVPPAFRSDPDGTTYQKGGKSYVKRGDRLIQENAR